MPENAKCVKYEGKIDPRNVKRTHEDEKTPPHRQEDNAARTREELERDLGDKK